jgi:hypothetical protein
MTAFASSKSCLPFAVVGGPAAVNISAVASGPADVAARDAPVASALLLTLLLAMLLLLLSSLPSLTSFYTGVSISSCVLLLSAFPNVTVLSSAGVDPAALVVLTAVGLSGILAVATISAVDCRPYPVVLTAVEVPGTLVVATISAVDAVPILLTSCQLLVSPMFLASLLLPIYLLLATLLLLPSLMFLLLIIVFPSAHCCCSSFCSCVDSLL